MICEKCGRNIYELEVCPFCNEPQDKLEEKKSTSANKAHYERAGEPALTTLSFIDRIKRENKGYKAFGILDTVRVYLMWIISILIVFFSLTPWLVTKNNFLYYLLTGIGIASPVFFSFMLLELPLGIINLIVFIRLMKKKNPSSRELFRCVCPNADGKYNVGLMEWSDFDVWQGISFRYNKTSFIISIVQRALFVVDTIISFIFAMITFILIIPASFGSNIVALFAGGVAVPLITSLVVININVAIINFVLKLVRKNSHKKLVESFKNGELE